MSDANTAVQDPINREHLGEITGGDTEFADELLTEFVHSIKGVIPRLQNAIQSADTAEVKSAAHAIKGASLSVGADVMSAAAKEIEQNAAAGSLDGVGPLFDALTNNFALVMETHGEQ